MKHLRKERNHLLVELLVEAGAVETRPICTNEWRCLSKSVNAGR
jgi:hypothetical protein